jgi:outer membrane protein assembly factor BamE
VDKAQVETLKPGMTRRQVSLIMGTPSIQDPFHQNRWDYAPATSSAAATSRSRA